MHGLREERKEAQADAAENQAEIDALSEDIDELLAAFNTLQEARDSAEAARNAAERSRDVARLEQANTEQKIAELEDEIAKTEESLAESAVSAFRSHQGPNSEQTALGSNPWRDARAEALRRFANLSTEDLLDEFRGQAAELEALREAATQKTVELEALHDKAQQTLETFNNALAVEDEAIEALNSRLDHRLAEAQYLEDLDAELAAKIRAEEQRIADAIAAATAAAAKRKPQIVTVPNNAYWFLPGRWGDQTQPDEEYIFRGVRIGAVESTPGFEPDDFAVPAFREVAERFPHHVLDVEIKIQRGPDGEDDPRTGVAAAEVLAAEIAELGRERSVIVSSFNDETLAAVNDVAPRPPALDLMPCSHGIYRGSPSIPDIGFYRCH